MRIVSYEEQQSNKESMTYKPKKEKWIYIDSSYKNELKNKVDFLALLESFGVSEIREKWKNSHEYKANCFSCDDDKCRLEINSEKKIFNCFNCWIQGDVFKLLEVWRGINDFRDNLLFLYQFVEGWNLFDSSSTHEVCKNELSTKEKLKKAISQTSDRESPTGREKNESTASEKKYEFEPFGRELKGLGIRKILDNKQNYRLSLEAINTLEKKYWNISAQTLEKFGVKYANYWFFKWKAVIPIYDSSKKWTSPQNILAYIGRTLEESRLKEWYWKYQFIKWFSKKDELFGMNLLLENTGLIKRFGIIIVEWFNDVLSLYDKNKKNVVALMGRTLTSKQEDLLLSSWADKFTLFLDKNQYSYWDKERDWSYKILLDEKRGWKHWWLYNEKGFFVRLMKYPNDENINEPEDYSTTMLTSELVPFSSEISTTLDEWEKHLWGYEALRANPDNYKNYIILVNDIKSLKHLQNFWYKNVLSLNWYEINETQEKVLFKLTDKFKLFFDNTPSTSKSLTKILQKWNELLHQKYVNVVNHNEWKGFSWEYSKDELVEKEI